MGLLDSSASVSFEADVKRIKANDRVAMRDEVDLSLRYFNKQQIADVENELMLRFPATQAGGSGQDIAPVCVPITPRFVAEQATLYNHQPQRWLSLEDGEQNDSTKELTQQLARVYGDAIGFDEVMHRWEQLVVLLGVCCLWPQIHKGKDGKLKPRPSIVLPHHLYPVPKDESKALEVDIADPDDYEGFVVETMVDQESVSSAKGAVYTYLADNEMVMYKGYGPEKPSTILGRAPQPLGMQPLVFWHRSLAVDQLLCVEDAVVARANRELNICWSVLMDTLRIQGWATPVKKLVNPGDAKARQVHGARFPVVLNIAEDYYFENSNAPFTEIMMVLRELVKQLAICERENPEDFSVEGAAAVSGFSKAVSSLPKITAREERAARARAVEQGPLWLRMRESLIKCGLMPEDVRKLKLNVQYRDIEFPQTPEEEAKGLETKFKYGLSSPAKELAHRRGITLEAAQAEIDENKAAGGGGDAAVPGEPTEAPTGARESGSMLERLINGGRKNKAPIGSDQRQAQRGIKRADERKQKAYEAAENLK